MTTVSFFKKVVHTTCMVALVAGVAVGGAVITGSDAFIGAAQAQEDGKKRKPETKRVEAHSQKGIEVLQRAQEMMEADNNAGAVSALGQIINNPGGYKGIDVAIGHKFRAYAYIGQDNYSSAMRDMEKAIQHPSLPDYDRSDMRYNMAQLYLAQEQYSKAINMLEQWFATAENPNANAYFFAAQAYALTNNLSKAESYVERGLPLMDPVNPSESNYRIASVVYIQRGKYGKAAPLLEKMISYWPSKKEYYTQLGGIYQEQNKEKDAFSMLAMVYDNKLGMNGSEIKRLSQLYMANGYPYMCAKIAEKGIADGKMKKNKENWELLGNCWFASREMKKALQPLTNAAKLSKDGQLYLRLCQSYVQEEDWAKAKTSCQNASNKGGLKENAGMAIQLKAIASYETGDLDSALDAFDACIGYDKTVDNCVKWKNHVQREIITVAREEQRAKAAAEEEARIKREREEEIRRTMQQSDEFSDSAEDAMNGNGGAE